MILRIAHSLGEQSMRTGYTRHLLIGATLAFQLSVVGAAHAEGFMDSLQSQLGSTSKGSSGLGSLLSSGNLTSANPSNVSGILGYCVKNNYLSGSSASSIQQQLLKKFSGGEAPSSDNSYKDGLNGILHGSNGQNIDLSGEGIKKKATEKACDFILKQGKSLL